MESLRQWRLQLLFMSKTTFLGYVPSLKSKHEATIVEGKAIESKGGSIRYTLRGEYKGRKTLPKTVTKADFEGIYGFDAKAAEEAVYIKGKNSKEPRQDAMFYQVGQEDADGFTPEKIVPIRTMNEHGRNKIVNAMKEADTVGSPSPASVEPPAPSDTPFPQEPSNASFSAEDLECVECGEMGAIECDTCDDICEECHRNSWGQDGYGAMDMALGHLTTEQIAELYDEDPNDLEALLDEYSYQGNDEADAIYDRFVKSMHSKTETKEAFGFGKEDEEEEEAEPTTQEFTVIMQEGDKLELTDIEKDDRADDEPKEEDNDSNEENEEKDAEMDKEILMICPSCDETVPEYSSCMSCGQQFEAEEGTRTFKITDIWYDTYDEEAEGMQGIKPFHDKHGYKQSHDQPEPSEMTIILDEDEGWGDRDLDMELADAVSDESGFCVYHYNWDEVKVKEAVSAKVTRPVKEEKEEDEESDEEGMSTLMKVGLGVGALAVGAAILGAEGEYSCPHCSIDLEVDGLDMSEKFTCPDCDGLIYESRNSGGHYPGDFMAEDEGESDYWAGENAEWRAEGHGKVMGYVHKDFRWETDPHPHEHDDLIDEMAVTAEMEREFEHQLEKGENHSVTSYTTVHKEVADGTEFIDVDVIGEFGSETVGSPSPSGPSSIPEPAEATGSEPSNENFSADKDYAYEPTDEEMAEIWEREQKMRDLEPTELLEDDDYTTLEGTLEKEADSKNMNWVIGLTALGIGISALGYSDKILALFDRFKK